MERLNWVFKTMPKRVLGFILLLFAQIAMAQTTDTIDCDFWWPEDEQVMWGVPEQMPNFPGGEVALMNYISERLVFPSEAKEAGVEGRVYVGFVVMEDGSLSCFKVLKGLGYGCDEAALEVFKDMPKWQPAMNRGKSIRYPYQVPVRFCDDEPVEQEMVWWIENMPEFPTGIDGLLDFIKENLVYPQEAIDAGLEGRVYVGFYVETDGSITGIKLYRGIGYGCDEAAMDVVRKMPKWKPGTQRGKLIRVPYMVPIKFELGNEKTK